ncbi:Transcriptional Regulator Erg [Manis pentadactyla]|nr:Transcriptional Regulator Erg [Manis pentadactyla]
MKNAHCNATQHKNSRSLLPGVDEEPAGERLRSNQRGKIKYRQKITTTMAQRTESSCVFWRKVPQRSPS